MAKPSFDFENKGNDIILPAYRIGLRGFGMAEMLVVLAMTAVLLGVALPGMAALTQRQQSDALVRLLDSAISFARNLAISGGVRVTLCRSEDGFQCGGSWSHGVIVFTDTDGDRVPDQGQQPVFKLNLDARQYSVYWRAFRNRQYLQFMPTGSTASQNGNFTICPVRGDLRFARQLIINSAGRVRHAVDSDGDGIVEDSGGRPVRC